ncbi:helix-turn-helix transcriptional regulator [Marinobacter sp. DUT-3]|uniref:helix-turn-helix transcriptional regulator n=1 Tax=Marinobacter sp. DUT-3 TaxID=3412036 RepID=UPI003D1803B7
MGSIKTAAPAMLNDLYGGAMNPDGWPVFLGKLARLFHTGTASLRVTDIHDPVVHRSYTVGFDDTANATYHEGAFFHDPFRIPLSEGPLGKIQVSHQIIADREFEQSSHYQTIFRPNGNFYAMGAQFDRGRQCAMHIGVHRCRRAGAFSPDEQQTLEFFSPHLKRAADLTRLIGQFESALQQAHAALDRLPFGVWILDHHLRCQWLNNVAEECARTRAFGLGLHGGKLAFSNESMHNQLRAAVRLLQDGTCNTHSISVSPRGASLALVNYRQGPSSFGTTAYGGETVLAFLLNPDRPVTLNTNHLMSIYRLTPAEIRLAGELVRGHDIKEASACLGISVHTARTQLKSVMQKMQVTRQADMVRCLLLGAASLAPEHHHA